MRSAFERRFFVLSLRSSLVKQNVSSGAIRSLDLAAFAMGSEALWEGAKELNELVVYWEHVRSQIHRNHPIGIYYIEATGFSTDLDYDSQSIYNVSLRGHAPDPTGYSTQTIQRASGWYKCP